MSSALKFMDENWNHRPLLLLIILLISTFFFWAATAEIDQQVRGIGRVIPSGKARVIQHLEGGIVREILVSEGQRLEPGDKLFVIENKKARAELKESEIQLQAFQITLQRLIAESQNMSPEEFDKKFEASFSEDVRKNYRELLDVEKELFHTRYQAFSDKINGLEERLRQKELRLTDLRTRIKNLQAELAVSEEKLSIKQKLRDSGAISRSAYLDVESEVKNFHTRISQVEKEIPITMAERDEALNLLSETRQNRQTEIAEELNEVKVDTKKIIERIAAMRDEVARTEIVSPVRGIVNKLYINTIGGVVQPGAEIAEIVPLDETLVVEGRIRTNDRGKIWIGLPVVAKITAYDYSIYGGIEGELTYISADSFINQNNEEFYQIRATLKSSTLGKDKDLFPGMTVELNIIADKISVLQAILRPFLHLQEGALREL